MFRAIQGLETLYPGAFNRRGLTTDHLLHLAQDIIGIICLPNPLISYGCAYRTEHNGRSEWYVFYNPNLPEPLKSIVLGHEIGHHFMTHWNYSSVLGFAEVSLFAREGLEKEASVIGLLSWIPTIEVKKLALENRLDPESLMAGTDSQDIGADFAYRLCEARIRIFNSHKSFSGLQKNSGRSGDTRGRGDRKPGSSARWLDGRSILVMVGSSSVSFGDLVFQGFLDFTLHRFNHGNRILGIADWTAHNNITSSVCNGFIRSTIRFWSSMVPPDLFRDGFQVSQSGSFLPDITNFLASRPDDITPSQPRSNALLALDRTNFSISTGAPNISSMSSFPKAGQHRYSQNLAKPFFLVHGRLKYWIIPMDGRKGHAPVPELRHRQSDRLGNVEEFQVHQDLVAAPGDFVDGAKPPGEKQLKSHLIETDVGALQPGLSFARRIHANPRPERK